MKRVFLTYVVMLAFLSSSASMAFAFTHTAASAPVIGSSRRAALITNEVVVLDRSSSGVELHAKLSDKRRKELGVADEYDEYDLDVALENNTDPIITKIIAGSLIVTILALLVVGVILPVTADYGDSACNPLLTGGRC
jgi:hypothetical protein